MRFLRKSKNPGYLLYIVAVAVFLRSFIAPGYMLKASAEDGLAIIFCDGPVSMYTPQDEHTGHHHHGEGDAQKETHISPICSQWSTSSVLVFNSIVEPLGLDKTLSLYINHYTTPYLQQFSDTNRVTRGPPA